MRNSTINLFFTALAGSLMFSCGFAEEMTDQAADSPEGMEMAYVINLDNTNENVARDTWKNYMNQHKSKVMRIKGSRVNLSKNVAITGLGGDIDVKSLFEQSGDDTQMKLWFVKDKKYITPQSDPAAYNSIDRFIDQYFTTLDDAHVKLEIKSEEKKLDDLDKQLNRLRKDNEKLHNDITRAEQTIKESRIKIEENLRDQDQLNAKIQAQRDVIQQTKKKLSEGKSN